MILGGCGDGASIQKMGVRISKWCVPIHIFSTFFFEHQKPPHRCLHGGEINIGNHQVYFCSIEAK